MCSDPNQGTKSSGRKLRVRTRSSLLSASTLSERLSSLIVAGARHVNACCPQELRWNGRQISQCLHPEPSRFT